MSDARETTLENALLNVTAALNITSTVVTELITTLTAHTTTPLETEKFFTVTTGAAQKITPTAKEIAFQMPPDSHTAMAHPPPT